MPRLVFIKTTFTDRGGIGLEYVNIWKRIQGGKRSSQKNASFWQDVKSGRFLAILKRSMIGFWIDSVI